MEWISVRLGTDHQLLENTEEVAGVMRTGPRFGVVLHAERPHVGDRQSLYDTVVEVDVGDLGADRFDHRVVVVLARDLDGAGGEAADRMVAAVVSEPELGGGAAYRRRQQLMPET